MEQMLLAKQDEAEVILTDEQNDFLFADALRMEETKELSANICLMAKIQPANIDSDVGPSYDSAFLSEVQTPSTSYVNPLFAKDNQEQKYLTKPKIINKSIGNDQIDSNIIFDEPNEDVNSGNVENDNNDSLQGMFMLGPKPMSFYDSKLKHGLGYANPYTLKKYISQYPKLYDASCLDDSKIHMNVRDTENILEDATKSLIKLKNKMKDPIAIEKKQNVSTIDYKKLNALYEDFVPQKEHSAEQKYFLPSFISPEDPINESSTYFSFNTKPTKKQMPSANPTLVDLNQMENDFQTFETWKQNELLKDQLLEAKLKHEIECCVLLSHECVDNKMHDEIEKIQRDFIEIQEGMQKRINILENDVQRCQKQSLDFELQLQHEKERRKCESSLKNVCETSWISKMEKLESENVSLEFQVQSLIKERENVKTEYQKLFDSIKRTRTQTQGEINELIENVNQKTYAYADVRAQNQDLLITISELKAKLKNVEKGKSVNTKFDKDTVSNKLLCVTPLNKQVFQKKTVAPKTEEKHVLSKTVTLQTSPNKQQAVETNKNVIAPGMYKVEQTQNTNTNKAKSVLSSTGLRATSSVRRPSNRDSSFNNSVLSNIKNSSKKVEVSDRKALFTTHRTVKSQFKDTTLVVSKTKIVVVTPLSAKHKVVQIILWIVDSGCSKHMTGLGHNLLSVGQFCDSDLEVAFRSNTCYVRNLERDNLLTRARESNLYTISISNMASSSPVYLLSKATSTKSWLWHRRLSHLNFGTINDLTKHDLVDGLPKFKYSKDHLCSACERGKSKKSSHPPKVVPSNHSKLELLHMDLCRPIRVASINRKKYILVIVDDYS
ncbi:integrase, catalytic region, zinc finger, CCHC-type containing protein [Tanacetum coccineum]